MSAARLKEAPPQVLAAPEPTPQAKPEPEAEPPLQLCLFEMPAAPLASPPQKVARRDHRRALWRRRSANYRLRKAGRQAELRLVAGVLGGAPPVVDYALAVVRAAVFSHPTLREIWQIVGAAPARRDVAVVLDVLARRGLHLWDRGQWLQTLAASGETATLDEINRDAATAQRALDAGVSDRNWRPMIRYK